MGGIKSQSCMLNYCKIYLMVKLIAFREKYVFLEENDLKNTICFTKSELLNKNQNVMDSVLVFIIITTNSELSAIS